jgi:DNA-binding CsgD family transcriptional regulator
VTGAWVGRADTERAIRAALASDDCRAVFIVAETGLGASSLLARISADTGHFRSVLRVQGSPSLSTVPYGVLAPYLVQLGVADVSSPVAVLRTLWAHLGTDGADAGTGPDPAASVGLILVDDAQAVDEATAEMITELVQAGWAKVVAACKPRPGIPQPMLRLWHQGAAERFDLLPLTGEESHELCTALLGGHVPDETSDAFRHASGGNPLVLKLLVQEALNSDALTNHNGIWLLSEDGPTPSPDLADVVRRQLMRTSHAGREALNLVALAEPVAVELVEELAGPDAVDELLEQQLVALTNDAGGAGLRLLSPAYGEVLRRLVPAARSLQLHQLLVSRLEEEPRTPEALLRMVTWALDCGARVPETQLLRAAVLACKLFQNNLALRIGAAIHDPDLKVEAAAVLARANFNLGRYRAAEALLERDIEPGLHLTPMLFRFLLRAVTRAAIGQSAAGLIRDGQALRRAGQVLGGQNPATEKRVATATSRMAALLDLLVLSLQGKYPQMSPIIEELLHGAPEDGEQDPPVILALTLALQAEQLCALGKPEAGYLAARTALEMGQPPESDVFFLPEFILVRQLSCSLSAGHWDQATAPLTGYAVAQGPEVVTFSGSSHLTFGMIAIRQGRFGNAVDILVPGVEALRHSDPQQLYGLCSAMAFYAAAVEGRQEEARRLEQDYQSRATAGMQLAALHAEAFASAGRGVLDRDGSGQADLLACAERAAAQGAALVELHALDLAIGLGDRSRLERYNEVAAHVEGPWAAALATYGHALLAGGGAAYLAAGEDLLAAGLAGRAAEAFSAALSRIEKGRNREATTAARNGLARSQALLGLAPVDPHADGKPRLTEREQTIVHLAAQGRTDREIAARLHISVRTVEGHLYRCYAKLGVSGREGLPDALGL